MIISPSQWTLLGSLIAYPALFTAATPARANSIRVAQSRELISIGHCTLMALLAGYCLYHGLGPDMLQSQLSATETTKTKSASQDLEIPLIQRKSEFANCITALETGYLLQDCLILGYYARQKLMQGSAILDARSPKGLNLTHLAWHHAGMSMAFLTLQWYIAHDRQKAIYIIVMLLLMNASSPLGTARWFLINFRPDRKLAIAACTVAYLATFAVFRVYLIFYIIRLFGKQQERSPYETFRNLRSSCQIGTGTLALVNSAWLVNGVFGFARRSLIRQRKRE